MHPILLCSLVLTPFAAAACRSAAPVTDPSSFDSSLEYPRAPRSEVVDDYHGTRVADPWRSLEDPDAPATRRWIEAQNALTRAWIDAVPERGEIEERLSELWNYPRHGAPWKKGGRYFFARNDGLQNQAVICSARTLHEPGRVLLDPNLLRADGTAALGVMQVSPDGRLLAYQVSEAGSDWNTIHVRDIESGRDLVDLVPWVKFSGLAWAHDSSGFYYSTYPDHDTTGTVALRHHRVLFHALGRPIAEDRIVYARDDQPDWGFSAWVSDDGEALVITQSEGTEPRARIFVADLRASELAFRPVFDAFDADYEVLGKSGARLWLRTDRDAPRNRIVAFDLSGSKPNECVEIVPEQDATLESALQAGGKLVLVYLRDAANEVRVHELDGREYDRLTLPGLGSIGEFRGELDQNEAFYSFTSFTTPTSVWRYDVAAKTSSIWRAPELKFEPGAFVTAQVFVASRDGTQIPMFVTHRRDVPLTPDTPTILYGYGGFNIAVKPAFSTSLLLWMERGGCFASANLRGGSEYGRAWHEAGILEHKQNVFDDFVAAAEFLIARGWTSPSKLAIHGRSNGGLLVGACLTQRPDLFAAAVPGVGVLDMLRYHRFTIGWAWSSDYGRADEPDQFPYLLAYSPLHNVKRGVRYPATLILTGDHDDRVVPAHSFKFAAELQEAVRGMPGAPPVLARIETRGGHGAGKPTSMLIEESADMLAFLLRALDVRGPSATPSAGASSLAD